MKRFCTLMFLSLLLSFCLPAQAAPRFIAFSLRAAQVRARTTPLSEDAARLGGMTDLFAIAYDERTGDVILVGSIEPGKEALWLDTFVGALRAVLKHGQMPEVSIEPPAERDARMQPVVFKGKLENTRLGREMLDADLLLKHLALGKLRAEVWGLPSYLSMAAGQAQREKSLPTASSRFWLSVGDMPYSGGAKEGAVLIHSARVNVSMEAAQAQAQGRNAIGEEYARRAADVFPELAVQYPAFGRVQPIIKMVSLAQHARGTPLESALAYWRDDYALPQVKTPSEVDLEEAREEIREINSTLVLSGGIRISPQIRALNRGDASALRQIVLTSRPGPDALAWTPPLGGWNITGATQYAAGVQPGQDSGFNMLQFLQPKVDIGKPVIPEPPKLRKFNDNYIPILPPDRTTLSPMKIDDRPRDRNTAMLSNAVGQAVGGAHTQVPWQPFENSRKIGGVMLSGTASVEGGNGSMAQISRGNFSLVVEGQTATLDPLAFRRFVTALWAVYFSDHDPGISIDPIAPGIDKHMVRYIGNVLNTDLGRVMREADYVMKKWAVGTERANIPGFRNPDDFIAQTGLQISGAHSRFWFVPEDMTFRRAGDMLLFSGGRMTVKTEYLARDLGARAEPANERFAEMFTSQYGLIAQNYPVYDELFEYAKLVSLAKYLKNSGAPLLWFLMANKDLVLTEDSPGTVDALAQGSKYYRNLTMSGGVDLKTGARYILDEAAMNAITRAMGRNSDTASPRSTLASAPVSSPSSGQPVTFELDKGKYSVLPQHATTAGRDARGNLYQTDLAVRRGGKPGLEMVRYFDERQTASGAFGNGWNLLMPYRIRPAGEDKQDFLNVRVPTAMVVDNLLTGQQETLSFSVDRYSIAGYVPDKLSSSQVVGMFLMSDASFRLADKFGNEFWFDPSGRMSDMMLADQERIHYQYLGGSTSAFERSPYQVRAAGADVVEYRGETLPKRILVRDEARGVEEALVFDLTQPVASYFPETEGASRYVRVRRAGDNGFRLEDRQGNQVSFRSDWRFEGMAPAVRSELVESITMGKQKIEMSYALHPDGRLVIAKAVLAGGGDVPSIAVRYEYNADGTLAAAERLPAGEALALTVHAPVEPRWHP